VPYRRPGTPTPVSVRARPGRGQWRFLGLRRCWVMGRPRSTVCLERLHADERLPVWSRCGPGVAGGGAWRQMRAPTSITVEEAALARLAAAEAGLVRTRSGSKYKPSALRGYAEAVRRKLLPKLGHMRLSSVSRNCVRDLVDRLVARGLAPSSVRNAILPLRANYRTRARPRRCRGQPDSEAVAPARNRANRAGGERSQPRSRLQRPPVAAAIDGSSVAVCGVPWAG
jgi:hypothetical protein